MAEKSISVDWQFGEEAYAAGLRRHQDEFEHVSSRGNGRRLRLFLALAVIALLLSIGGAFYLYARYQVEVELDQIGEQIGETVDLEVWAWQRGDWEVRQQLVDPNARPEWLHWYRQYGEGLRHWADGYAQQPRMEVAAVKLLDADLALVTLRIPQAEVPGDTVWRESRIYRQVGDGWLRTSPPLAHWGAAKSLTTATFRFQFYARDQAAVETVAGQIDDLYAGLRRRMGVMSPPRHLTVRVVPDHVGTNAERFSGGKLVILSPLMARTPVQYSPAQGLAASIIPALSRRVLDESLGNSYIQSRWHVMYWAVRDWLAADAEHALMSPSTSNPVQTSVSLATHIKAKGLPPLASLRTAYHPLWTWESGWLLEAGESVVAYALARYGVERLPALVQGFVRYETWEELTSATFGVSATEFEAGWHTYLRQRYALPLE